ncbi:flagellar hook-associated protein FlgK [Erwinia tasmaniensis]|uniref:Flagellar hook-associated protein 1 n=1 Tax=Erwinia tasmaniensis (strain DSM 17950 / CFBP 7177 / CIP 109463 / NCPPB 4357 / Et1/99) TaxID=465817 RepID=B2VDL8_ERWT9|nr:flagellar hook-associated protein FlgK [Erwinia tasmaniensis]CAO97078.1 Flagellar hook-filament junction protein 1 [Erwinia tasmaniensis Et1/99]
MANLINTAMTGLNAASAALNTTSNNITNYAVTGYSRQTTVLAQNSSTLSGSNYYGNGASVSNVYREYDQFISKQLLAASTQSSAISTQAGQMSNIDDMLSGTTNTLSTNIQDFFKSLQTLSSNAGDSSSRQAVLGKAEGLVNQLKVTDTYLTNLDNSLNVSVKSTVDQVNNYAKQIANVNQQITKLKGVGAGNEPNDLLDQRDQLVSQLNKLVGVNVSQQDGGSFNISVGNGISLVQGDSYNQLAAVPSSADPGRTTIASVDSVTGAKTELPESLVTTGSLGGLLAFRKDLDGVRNQVGQLALALGSSFNTQHEAGLDSNGDKGEAFFNLGSPVATSNGNNKGDASLTVAYDADKIDNVKASNYKMTWDGGSWNVVRLSDNAQVKDVDASTPGTVKFDGLTITVGASGTLQNDDSYTIKPVTNVISGMSVNITDEAKLATAGSTGGASNNENVKSLLALQTKSLINGTSTLTQAYAGLVADVGNKTSTLETTSTTQTAVVTQLTKQQQSVSGVNLDEEYSNLARYQQYYMANAKVLQTASTIFQSLLTAVG